MTHTIDHYIDIALGEAEAAPDEIERRAFRRLTHPGELRFIQWTPTAGKSAPISARCLNLCPRSMRIETRPMLHEGYESAVLMQRTNGEHALLGARVIYSDYIGNDRHESGVVLTWASGHFALDDFRDENTDGLPELRMRAAA